MSCEITYNFSVMERFKSNLLTIFFLRAWDEGILGKVLGLKALLNIEMANINRSNEGEGFTPSSDHLGPHGYAPESVEKLNIKQF